MSAQNPTTELAPESVYQAEITGYTHDGRGVARVAGRVVFVPGAIRGETVELAVVKHSKNAYAARLLRVLQASAERRQSVCPAFESCGGCALQHMSYAEELRFKQEKVRAALQRLGGLADELPIRPIMGAAEPYHYRNKGVFHLAREQGRNRLVFWDEASHQPANGRCRLLFPFILDRLAGWLENETLPPNVMDIMLRYAPAGGALLLALILADANTAEAAALLQKASANFPELQILALQTPRGWQTISQEKQLPDELAGVKYLISPPAFFQVNDAQTEKLLEALAACFDGSEHVLLDAYCGIGTLGLYLTKKLPHLQQLIGVELNPSAVNDAKANAALNGINNAAFYCGAAEKEFPGLSAQYGRPDVVIVDPPRRGCHPALLDGLLELAPPKIVYVSCDPATLARDLGKLAGAYRPLCVQPLDMFPRTKHVETVCHLVLRKPAVGIASAAARQC